MCQCILNIPLWNDWYTVYGSPVFRALLFQSFWGDFCDKMRGAHAVLARSSCSFSKIQNVGGPEISEEKYCFIGERFNISFIYIFPLVLLIF